MIEDKDSLGSRSLSKTEVPVNTLIFLNILLVEEDEISQDIIKAILKKYGHKIFFADNDQEAIEMWRARIWDSILMNIQMQVMSGMEATREIRRLENADIYSCASINR